MPTLFLDLDGTLTDPKEGITRCIRYALERLGEAPPAADELTRYIGPPLLETFAELVGEARAADALALYRERFADVGWQENRRFPGMLEALEALASAGSSLFVATSKPRVYAERIVDHFGLAPYFRQVFGSELDGRRTDKAELLRHALEVTGAGADSVMIGDRRHDIAGARANGLAAVGVTWGYGSLDELSEAGAHAILHAVPELAQLPSVLAASCRQ